MSSQESTVHRLLTVEEYLQLEDTSPIRHEYVGGFIYAFAGASDTHARIVMNIAGHLWLAARGGVCSVSTNDLKLQATADSIYYPDIMVVCDPSDDDPLIKSDPIMIVEVLSPSTEEVDKIHKRHAYLEIGSLQTYLIVAQDERRVIRHWRDEEGEIWWAELVNDGQIPLPFLGIELTIDDIYEGIEFE